MTKLNKKSINVLLVAAMTMALATGCSKKSNDAVNTPAEDNSAESSVKAGTYTATEAGFGGDITVTVKVAEDGKIESIEVDAPDETPALGGAAAPEVAKSIVDNQSLAVDTVSGATVSSTAVITAVTSALTEAGVDTDALSK